MAFRMNTGILLINKNDHKRKILKLEHDTKNILQFQGESEAQ